MSGYEAACARIQEENGALLELFREDMQGLNEKTINRHMRYVDFYINDYLLREDPLDFTSGVNSINGFLGYFLEDEYMFSPTIVKNMAASIRRFYRCMLKHGKIGKEEYASLCSTIKEYMPDWLCGRIGGS